jgi:hypothetical protein
MQEKTDRKAQRSHKKGDGGQKKLAITIKQANKQL